MGMDVRNLFGDEFVTMSGVFYREEEDIEFDYQGVFVKNGETYFQALEKHMGGFPKGILDADITSYGKSTKDYELDATLNK